MVAIKDGYYFMFEIGWFLDLLIPTLVRIKGDCLYLVGSRQCDAKDIKPCCIPAGGVSERKTLSLDDPSIKAFKNIDSLVFINDLDNLAAQLSRCFENKEINEKYLNTKAKMRREATIERIMSDYQVLSAMEA
jgi:hypothetical protein